MSETLSGMLTKHASSSNMIGQYTAETTARIPLSIPLNNRQPKAGCVEAKEFDFRVHRFDLMSPFHQHHPEHVEIVEVILFVVILLL